MDEREILNRIETADEDELKEMKLWLFQENIRLRNEKLEIKEMREGILTEREQIREDQQLFLNHLSLEREQVRRQEELIEEKLAIIKRGFDELDADRRKLKAKEAEFRTKEIALDAKMQYCYTADSQEVADVLFRGVTNYLSLRKRYKDLMKIYHPDALAGDNEMVLAINRVYDKLKAEYELEKVAW